MIGKYFNQFPFVHLFTNLKLKTTGNQIEEKFHEWCHYNNIGNNPTNIQGIVKSDMHVFWKGECPVNFVKDEAR